MAMLKFRSEYKKGFTLIEIMITVAIIGLLVGISISQYSNSANEARRKRAQADIKNICEAIKSYNRFEKKKFYQVKDISQLQTYLPKLSRDPWGNPYKADGTYVYSMGVDGKSDSPETRADDLKAKYERDSIVENPTFVATQSASGVERPGAWKLNPEYDPANQEPGAKNVIKIDKSNTTAGGNSVVIK